MDKIAGFIFSLVMLSAVISGTVYAHCDTESGPVAADARQALETATVTAGVTNTTDYT
jgi:hypothetical protein